MKKLIALVIAAAMIIGLAACGTPAAPETTTKAAEEQNSEAATEAATEAAPVSDEVYELSFSMHDGSQTVKYQMTEEWAKKLEEKSNGRLHITIYPGGALAGQKEVVEAVETGAADFGMVYTSSYDSVFALTNGICLPMIGVGTAQQATYILWDMYNDYPEMQAEFDGIKLVHMYSNGSSYFQFVEGKKVDTYDAISGLKIRSGGGSMTDYIEACGATPMTISTSELYESLEKGLVDGSVSNGSQMASWNLSEVEPYYLDMPLYVGVWMTIMNEDKFNSLPADLQELIMSEGGLEGSLIMADYLQDENESGYVDALANGGEWVEIADSEVEKFKAAADGYVKQWITDHSANGFDAQGYYDYIIKKAEEYKDK